MKRIHKRKPCPPTKVFLRATMPLVVVYALAILASYLQAREQNFLLAKATYAPFLEYIVASCAILVCGALLIEIAWWEQRR
ncbi:MAG: hypothetical protein IKJ35_08730 [Clostridia bacterium]|nr:hypothetical protein [Clostridia bacterium]